MMALGPREAIGYVSKWASALLRPESFVRRSNGSAIVAQASALFVDSAASQSAWELSACPPAVAIAS
jgi:hypothetical protein